MTAPLKVMGDTHRLLIRASQFREIRPIAGHCRQSVGITAAPVAQA